jgi:heme exporter protein B
MAVNEAAKIRNQYLPQATDSRNLAKLRRQMNEFSTLFRRELTLEFRRVNVVSGLVLYLVSTCFLIYMIFLARPQPSGTTWSALFWIVALFSSVNAVAKNFSGESRGHSLYLYTLFRPERFVLVKLAYGFVLCLFLTLAGFTLFQLFFPNPFQDQLMTSLLLVLSALGFSSALTLISAISSRVANGGVLMAVLGLPVVIGLLLLITRLSNQIGLGIDRAFLWDDVLRLLAVDLLMAAVTYILYPFVWRS